MVEKNCFTCKYALPLYFKSDTFVELRLSQGCYCNCSRRGLDGELVSPVEDAYGVTEECICWEE